MNSEQLIDWMNERREQILAFLCNDLKEVQGMSFTTRRRAIDWGSWPFDLHPFAVSIIVRKAHLPGTGAGSEQSMVLVVDMMTDQIEYRGNPSADHEIEGSLIKGLAQALGKALLRLSCSGKDTEGKPLVQFIGEADFETRHNEDCTIQGLVALIPITF